MVQKYFVFSTIFCFLHFHRLPSDLENARVLSVLYKIKIKLALCIRNLNCKSLTDFICHKLVSLTIYDFCLLSTVIVGNSTGSVHHVQKNFNFASY